MKCPVCDVWMKESMDPRFKTWTCRKCGWRLQLNTAVALAYYDTHHCAIDDQIEFDPIRWTNWYDLQYHSPVIRDDRGFVGADIGEFITANLKTGKRYRVLIKFIEVE